MPRNEPSPPDQTRRDANREAQRRVAAKREEVGHKQVKLYLDPETVKAIEQIAQRLGFEKPKPKTKKRIEVISTVVTYCVQQFYNSWNEVKPESRLALEYWGLYQTVSYLERENDAAEIAALMSARKFPRPQDILYCHRNSLTLSEVEVGVWNEDDVEYFSDFDIVEKDLQTLNEKKR